MGESGAACSQLWVCSRMVEGGAVDERAVCRVCVCVCVLIGSGGQKWSERWWSPRSESQTRAGASGTRATASRSCRRGVVEITERCRTAAVVMVVVVVGGSRKERWCCVQGRRRLLLRCCWENGGTVQCRTRVGAKECANACVSSIGGPDWRRPCLFPTEP